MVQLRGEVVFVCADTPLGELGRLAGLTVFNPEIHLESAAEPPAERTGQPEGRSTEGREGSTNHGYAES
jgi:hypothetical protein